MSRAPMKTTLEPEIKPASQAREMFISPRVLDEAAFDRFAETLKGMIDEAARAGGGVRDAVRAANRVLELYQEAGVDELADRTDDLRSAVERSRGTERTLARAREEATLQTQRLERVALAASDAIEAQRAGLERVVDAVRAETDRAKSQVRAELEGAGGSAREQGEEMREQIEGALRERLDSIAQEAVREVEARIAGARAAIDEASTVFETRTVEARAEVEALETRVERALDRLGEIDDDRLDRIEKLVSKLSGGPRKPGVELLAKRLGETMPEAEEAIGRLDSLVSQTDVARKTLAEAILKGSKAVDALEARASHAASKAGAKHGS